MLNPAMLALNPEKYAAKMEAINTVYQNVKESREQMQQMLELNQQELERQLFEAEASWSEKLEKKADEFLEEACDYLKRSAERFFWGNFTEEVTLLGVGCQIAVGFTGVDLPFDVRDIIADIINLAEAEEWDWGLVGILLLDLCALLPVIGCLKYVDEAAVLAKHADEAADLVKHADKLKYVDEAGELLTEGRKLADSGIKGLEDAVAEAQKLEKELAGSKLLDDVAGGGRGERLIPGTEGVVTGGDSTKLGKNMMESMGLPRGTNWTGHQAQHIIPAEMANHPVLQRIGMDLDDASNGLFLRTPADDISAMSRHRGYHSTYNEFVRTQLDGIDLNQSVDILQKQVYDLQQNLKYLQQSGLPLYPSQGATVDLWQRSWERIQ